MEIEKEVPKPDNLCIIAIGMAGSGKTTFVSVLAIFTIEIRGAEFPETPYPRNQLRPGGQNHPVQAHPRHPRDPLIPEGS